MKAGIVGAAALGLASFAVAHEHHHARHVQFHQHRDVHVETVTDYVTVEKEEIVVYLDEDGKPVKTSTFYSGVETPTPAPKPATSQAPAPKVSSAASKVAADFHQVVPSVSIPKPSIPSPSVHVPSGGSGSGSGSGSLPSPASGDGFGRGLSYSPYNNDNSCKSASQVASDLSGIISQFDMVRIYGVDCNQVANTIQALAGKNVRIMSGVFDVGSWQSETQQIIDAVKNNAGGNWGIIHTVSIGNEAVNSGTASVGEVTSAVSGARSMLRSAGFQGPVVTVDTMVAFQNNPELVSTSDFLAMNCHPFFDPNTDAQGAGEFVTGWIQKLGSVANGKLIAITETGWPSCGSPNGKAVGTPQNQQSALSSLKGALSSNVVLYSAYNQLWKQNNANTFNAEQCWGMFN